MLIDDFLKANGKDIVEDLKKLSEDGGDNDNEEKANK